MENNISSNKTVDKVFDIPTLFAFLLLQQTSQFLLFDFPFRRNLRAYRIYEIHCELRRRKGISLTSYHRLIKSRIFQIRPNLETKMSKVHPQLSF